MRIIILGFFLALGSPILNAEDSVSLTKVEWIQKDRPMWGITLSPDKTRICMAGTNHPLEMWDLSKKTDVEFDRPPGGNNSRDCKFSPDGKWLAASDDNGSAYLIDSKELKVRQKLVGGSSSVSHLAFSPSGEWLAAGGTAPKFLLWNIDSGELIWEQAMGQFTVEGIAFDPRERFVAVTKNARGKIENQPWSQSTIEYLDAYLKKSVFEISVDRLAYSPVFTPDGGLLAWFHEEGNNVISVLEVASGKIIYRHEIGFAGGVTSLAIHPNGRWLISGHRNGMIAVWDILTGESLYKKLEPGVAFVKVATTSDGKHLLTSSGSQTKWHVGVWSFEMAPKAAKAQKGIGKTEWQDLWAALLETNTKTLSTLSKMVDHGSESVKFLETELKVDGPVVDTKSVSALIRQLGDEDFDKRQEASQALANADAADELHKALASSNPEVVYRVKKILKTHPAKSFLVKDPSEIRRLRAIQVLEYIGTEEARALTLRLAEKDSSVNVRSAARSALQRTSKK